jgi:hypothetical protein
MKPKIAETNFMQMTKTRVMTPEQMRKNALRINPQVATHTHSHLPKDAPPKKNPKFIPKPHDPSLVPPRQITSKDKYDGAELRNIEMRPRSFDFLKYKSAGTLT